VSAFTLRDPFRLAVTDADGNVVTIGNVVVITAHLGDGRVVTFGDIDVWGPPAPEDLLPLIGPSDGTGRPPA
jgi:hypothetical protein